MSRVTARISCIIPVFNGERFLAEAVDSVRRQSVPVYEIIVVDDGSVDRTAAVVAELGPNVTYVYQENQGASAARRQGAAMAQGEYIAFLDADDLWRPEKIASQLACMEAAPRLGACTTYMQNFWMAEVEGELPAQSERLTAPQPGVASTVFLRSAAYRAIGPLDETLRHRDIQDLLARLQAAGWAFTTLSEVLVDRRIHGSNISRNRVDTGEQELLRLAAAALLRRRASTSD